MPRMLALWAPAVGYAALIWFVSAMPAPAPGLELGWLDKPIHAAEYAVLAALLLHPLRRSATAGRAAVLAIAIAASYGVVDEIHQHFVPPREPSVGDAVADLVGASLVALGWLWRKSWRSA